MNEGRGKTHIETGRRVEEFQTQLHHQLHHHHSDTQLGLDSPYYVPNFKTSIWELSPPNPYLWKPNTVCVHESQKARVNKQFLTGWIGQAVAIPSGLGAQATHWRPVFSERSLFETLKSCRLRGKPINEHRSSPNREEDRYQAWSWHLPSCPAEGGWCPWLEHTSGNLPQPLWVFPKDTSLTAWLQQPSEGFSCWAQCNQLHLDKPPIQKNQ